MLLEHILLLFGLGLFSGFINVVAGGGSVLTIPGLIYTGLEATIANGTNRIAILVQSSTAVAALWKEVRGNIRFYTKISLLTLPGAIAGALLAVKVSDKFLEILIGIVMILVIFTMVYPVKKEKNPVPVTKLNWKIVTSLLLSGIYGGFLQIGIGFVLMAIFHRLMKYDLVRVNVMKVFVVSFFTVPALLIFILNGKVVFLPGIVLALGNAIGAWSSAKISLRKGEKFIRFFLFVAIIVMSLELFGII
ncbi:MAG: sulfite exporter TauE/SafE family protein [Candidatus Kapabacteria bacterium]|nr:sulfite exporter TauE/SafE family protein [Ignavibacteriota bacterium]MCW5884092.1 sulfite exporter TauE/SafE family protein [Candidatus Kapabacteria bacterium]